MNLPTPIVLSGLGFSGGEIKLLSRHFIPITTLAALIIIAALYMLRTDTFSGIVTDVHDGQTIQVYHQNKHRQIQLIGVDAPKMGEPFSREARDYVLSLVGKKRVVVEVKGTGPGDLVLAEVFYTKGNEKLSLNRDLIRSGLARWDRAYLGDSHFQDLEHQAKHHQRGMWAPPAYHASAPAIQPRPQPAPNSNNLPRNQTRSGAESVYKWVDDNGTVHFSDRPANSASEQIQVERVQTFSSPHVPQTTRVAESGPQVRYEDLNPRPRQVSFESVATVQVNKGVFQSSEGYRITANAKHFGKELSFEGRVDGGPSCRALKLTGYLTSQKGEVVWRTARATDVGSGSRL
jgi:micrococcal nuclease